MLRLPLLPSIGDVLSAGRTKQSAASVSAIRGRAAFKVLLASRISAWRLMVEEMKLLQPVAQIIQLNQLTEPRGASTAPSRGHCPSSLRCQRHGI